MSLGNMLRFFLFLQNFFTMKAVILLSVLFVASTYGIYNTHDYQFPNCYKATTYKCQNAMPALGAWTNEVYCTQGNVWVSLPCRKIELQI